MIFTRLRLILAGVALLGVGYGLWQVHDALAERRVRTAVDALHVKQERQEAERLAAAREHHAEVAALMARNEALKRRINVENDPHCNWDAHTVRLLNAARGHGRAARQPDGPLSAVARADGSGDAPRAAGRRD